jgi:hypothetical protein
MSSQLRCTKRGRLGLSHGKAAAKRRVHLLLRAPHHAGAELALLALVQFSCPERAERSSARLVIPSFGKTDAVQVCPDRAVREVKLLADLSVRSR